jgi:hypothetical protein
MPEIGETGETGVVGPFPRQNAPNSFELGRLAEQPSPEVCSQSIMPAVPVECLFKIAQ